MWEHELYDNINIIKQRPFFIQFSARSKQVRLFGDLNMKKHFGQIGLNFADQQEAADVFELIKEKSKRNKESKLTVKPVHHHQQQQQHHHQQQQHHSYKPAPTPPMANIQAVQESGMLMIESIYSSSFTLLRSVTVCSLT